MRAHAQTYRALYTEADDRQGKLTDSNNLQYTFDFLTLEELDYLHGLLNAPQVKIGLSSQWESLGEANQYTEVSWIVQVLSNLVDYACITAEDEVMWEMDINIFLVEETSATENYTHRAACASFARRLCGWLPQQTLGSLLFCMKTVFDNGSSEYGFPVNFNRDKMLMAWISAGESKNRSCSYCSKFSKRCITIP